MQVIKANKTPVDTAESERLLALLDGLPLAIAQAGAYFQESGVGLTTYLRFYKQQWSELMAWDHLADAPLQDYPDHSMWTTWAISYQMIRKNHVATANLLLMWSFLDNRDLWYGLFADACQASETASIMLSKWIEKTAVNEIEFSKAMVLLCDYSLAEQAQETRSYAMHAVVHKWVLHFYGMQHAMKLSRLAVVTVGWAILSDAAYYCSARQRRLLSHAQACFGWVEKCAPEWMLEFRRARDTCTEKTKSDEALLEALHLTGLLCVNQGRLAEAKQIYKWALCGQEVVLGPTHTSTLTTINDLGVLYQDQRRLRKAKCMYKRALRGRATEFGQNDTSTLETVNNLATLFEEEEKLNFAERMYIWALRGKKQATGPNYLSILHTTNNLGTLYAKQGKLSDARRVFEQALKGYENSICGIYFQEYLPALDALENVGNLYTITGEHYKAYSTLLRAWPGLERHYGRSSERCKQLLCKIIALFLQQASVQ
jgi:tetratricopeptide (TPR) repeat protein